jgi:hypothetical protein
MMFSSPMAMMLFKLIVVLAATGCLSTPVRSAPVVRVGESFVVAVGETVTVPILVSEALDLKSFQFDLGYDETILELLAFTDAGTDFEERRLLLAACCSASPDSRFRGCFRARRIR